MDHRYRISETPEFESSCRVEDIYPCCRLSQFPLSFFSLGLDVSVCFEEKMTLYGQHGTKDRNAGSMVRWIVFQFDWRWVKLPALETTWWDFANRKLKEKRNKKKTNGKRRKKDTIGIYIHTRIHCVSIYRCPRLFPTIRQPPSTARSHASSL